MNKKVTVVMPTYNRPECIRYFIENSVKPYQGKLFVFEIHDSSENDETKAIVTKCKSVNLKYFRYPSTLNGGTKACNALKNVKTDFMYLLGDGFAPDFNELESVLMSNHFYDYDLIGLFHDDFRYTRELKRLYPKNKVLYKQDSYDFLITRNTVCFTLYGASIASRRLMRNIVNNKTVEKYEYKGRNEYSYCLACLEELHKDPDFKCGIIHWNAKLNPMKKGNWAHDETFYDIFYLEWQSDFEKFPVSEKIKKETLKNIARFHFSFKGILYYKFRDVFTPKLLMKYRPYIKKCRNHYWFMWVMAFTPKWLLRMAYKPFKMLKRYKG